MNPPRGRRRHLIRWIAAAGLIVGLGSAVGADAEPALGATAEPDAAANFVPVEPLRLFDSRVDGGPVVPGDVLVVELEGVPADAAGAALNVTAVDATGDGFFSVWDCDGDAPATSNGNYVGVRTIANTVITSVGDDAVVCVVTGQSAAEIIVDVFGYFAAGSGFEPSGPLRLFDSRVDGGPVVPGDVLVVELEGVPVDAAGVVLNVTAVDATGHGFFSVWDCDGDAPATSNGNYVGVRTIANTVITSVGDDAVVCVVTGQSAAEIIVDVFGYFAAGSGFEPSGPSRVFDTRHGGGPLVPGSEKTVLLDPIHAGRTAILNVTAVDAAGHGFFSVWDCDGDAPATSNLNFVGVPTIANSVVIGVNGAAGKSEICVVAGQSGAHLIVDVFGSMPATAGSPQPSPSPPPPASSPSSAARAGGSSLDVGKDVSVLPDGSAIVTGRFSDSATFGTWQLQAAGGSDVFVAKVDADGEWSWATSAGGSGQDVGYAVSVLPDGSAVVTGEFSGVARFGSTLLSSVGGSDVFVARVSAAGEWSWATSAGGSGQDVGYGVSVLANGSAVVTGEFSGVARFGSTLLSSVGGSDVFVARVSAAGEWSWATSAGGAGLATAFDVSTVLEDGSAIVAGFLSGPTRFGATLLPGRSDSDAFVAKVDANGDWAWATSAGGAGVTMGHAVSATSDGSAVVTGFFSGAANFGESLLQTSGGADVFVAKVDADGEWMWAAAGGGIGVDVGLGVSVLDDGSAIVTGEYGAPVMFGSTFLPQGGSADVFVAKIGADGDWLWATGGGGTGRDVGFGVSAATDGSAIVTGRFEGTARFGSAVLPSAGRSDVFVMKVRRDGSIP